MVDWGAAEIALLKGYVADGGLELVQVGGKPIAGLVEYGERGGQVLVIAGLGILRIIGNGAKNVEKSV